MSELQPLYQLLLGKLGWLPAVLTWMSALRLALKPINIWLRDLLAGYIATSDQPPAWLRSHWYRFLVFLLDYITSIKLPTALPLPPGGSGDGGRIS